MVITLAACSNTDDASFTSPSRPTGAPSNGGDQPQSYRSGIFTAGIPLQEALVKGWARGEQFDEAARELPTAGACIKSDRQGPASLAIDWNKIGSDIEASVCLTRVAQKVGSERAIIKWLEAQGFEVNSIRQAEKYETWIEKDSADVTVIEADWSFKEKGGLYRKGLFNRLSPTWPGYSVGVHVYVGRSPRIIYAAAITNTL